VSSAARAGERKLNRRGKMKINKLISSSKIKVGVLQKCKDIEVECPVCEHINYRTVSDDIDFDELVCHFCGATLQWEIIGD
jgi:transcription elongation factor Elf1